MKPRLKPFVEYCYSNGKISFFARPGVAIEIDDQNKYVLTACQLLDGCRDIQDLKSSLSKIYPEDAENIEELLELLDSEGLLEDVSTFDRGGLTEYDVERWSRNAEFFGAYCKSNENKFSHQKKIKNTKVTLLGLGGVGSSVLMNLAALGVKNIRIVDFDKVELSNLNRQVIYNEADIGKFKAEIARDKILAFYPDANIEPVSLKIASSLDIENLIDGRDFVINAADQPRGEMIDWLNVACVNKRKPFICGALDYRYAVCYSVVPGQSGCIECWKVGARQSSRIFQDYLNQDGFFPAPSLNVAIMPFISIVGGLVAADFLKIVTGIKKPASLGKLQSFDFETGHISIIESWEKNAECLMCGELVSAN
ncbi:MAG: thiamine biosynthesis protein ThiF [Gammaproteobacteria bacterium RIFCSPHIGHO2_12_FULL_45_12]|nr:MAG: thiamine biosynthesis protein ThiF [Gammaproteobacteria bacterium RIFCSPHIGHO2_12_FULL_45_12]